MVFNTMEQAIKVLSMSKSIFRHRRHKSAGKEGGIETEEEPRQTPSPLFPVTELLEQLLRQEAELWKKNEGLVQAHIRGEHYRCSCLYCVRVEFWCVVMLASKFCENFF